MSKKQTAWGFFKSRKIPPSILEINAPSVSFKNHIKMLLGPHFCCTDDMGSPLWVSLSEWISLFILVEIFKIPYSIKNSIFKWIIIELGKNKCTSLFPYFIFKFTVYLENSMLEYPLAAQIKSFGRTIFLSSLTPFRVFHTLWSTHTFVIICQRNPFIPPNCTSVCMEPFGQKRTNIFSKPDAPQFWD